MIIVWKYLAKYFFNKFIDVLEESMSDKHLNRKYLISFFVYFGLGVLSNDWIFRVYTFIELF